MRLGINNKRILVAVAHPDDELLGCGATMHKLIHENNCTIRAVILCEGITSRSDKHDPDNWSKELKEHRNSIYAAKKIIGYESVGIYDFPDNRFDTVPLLDIIKTIEKEKDKFKPEVIFTHHGGDLNIDHQKTFEAVITVTRPMKEEKVKGVITFETPSGTEWIAATEPRRFIPNLFIDVSQDDLNAKIKGMESYIYEKRKHPHPRSPEALRILAERYGVMIGTNYAEAFQIVRIIS